jgi:hypothetical protein
MGRKHKPALTIDQIAGVEEVLCNGRMHRVVLLNDGQIALPDHPRKLLRLEDEMLRKARESSCGCLTHVRALQAGLKANWDGTVQRAYASSSYSNGGYAGPKHSWPKHSSLFANRTGEIQSARKSRTAFKAATSDPLVLPFNQRVARKADQSFRLTLTDMKAGSRRETNIREFHASDPDCQVACNVTVGWRESNVAGNCGARYNWALYFDVLRWYTKVYTKGLALVDGVLVLKILQADLSGKPTQIMGLKPTPGGQAAQVGLARVTPTGRVLFKGSK